MPGGRESLLGRGLRPEALPHLNPRLNLVAVQAAHLILRRRRQAKRGHHPFEPRLDLGRRDLDLGLG